jgi:hypothetical protein
MKLGNAMNETIEAEGTCLCSAVKIRAKSMRKEIGISTVKCVASGLAHPLWG